MASIAVVSPAPRERVRGSVDVVVELRLDDDGVDRDDGGGSAGAVTVEDVEVVVGPAEKGTRTASPVGSGADRRGAVRRYRYRWQTRDKLARPDETAPGDALFWITATARVGGVVLRAPYVPVLTANEEPQEPQEPEEPGEPGGGQRPVTAPLDEEPASGGWREELAWAADLSGSVRRWAAGHSAVVGARAATVVDDPVLGPSRRVLRVVVPDSMGDDADQPTPTTVRFQASSPQVIREGDELCVGFAVLLPRSFPTVYPTGDPANPRGPEGTGYVALFQVYGPPYRTGASLVLHADRRTAADPLDELTVRGNELNPGDPEALLAMPYRRGTWTDVVLRLRVSSSIADGWVETYVNQGESAGVRPLPLAGVGVRVPRVVLREDSEEFRTDLQVYRVKNRIPSVGVWFAGHRIARTVEEADPGSHAPQPGGEP